MIVDIYNFFKEHPKFRKLIGPDYLIVEYKCPLDVDDFNLWTDTHMFTYVVSGKKDWFSEGKKYEVTGGDALFMRKGVFSTRQYFEVEYCVILFFMSDEFIRNFILENESLELPEFSHEELEQIFRIDVDDPLKSLILSVYNYFKQDSEIPRDLVEMKFRELLYNILMNPNNRDLARYFSSIRQSDTNSMEHILSKNFQHDLKMEDFARLTGRSLSSFKRDFKKIYNQTPGKWLMNKRLDYAKSLLQNSAMNVNEVCFESGFKNSSHFNKVFKEKFSMPPKQFREVLINE